MLDEIPAAEFGLVDVADAAAKHRVTVRSVQRWIEAGLIPVLAAGPKGRRVYLLRESDVKAFNPPPMGRRPKPKPEKKPAAKKGKSRK
jgi:hypothetical protein